MNVQNKYAKMSYERRLASGILAKTIKNFKGCTIQSTINNSVYYESDEQVDRINYQEEQIDERNWLRKDSAKQVDQINDSEKEIDAISDSRILVDTGSDPSSDPNVATYTPNGNFTQNY